MVILAAGLLAALASDGAPKLVHGGFEHGLRGWTVAGEVSLDTSHLQEGAHAAVIGPGKGSLSQRIATGSGDHLTVSALLDVPGTNGWVFRVRFLDSEGRELMQVDSLHEIKPTKKDPRKFSIFMKTHPLTRWTELVLAKDSTQGKLRVEDIELNLEDENSIRPKPAFDLDQAMQPFWSGNSVRNEAVLMLSQSGRPASGQLMFQPSRIISVQDYGLTTHYQEGTDYTVEGRTLVCTPSSHLTRVDIDSLTQGELNWNTTGGKQVMVTYEHADTWNHPRLEFIGWVLPRTLHKLRARAPLKVVAFGDSITHGVGSSSLAHIPPFLPPWPELFVHRLQSLYGYEDIRLYNSAQSGATSEWGKDFARRMVATLDPDLVLVAFGQNDFWNTAADVFASNVLSMVQTVRRECPHAEFLLVSTMRFDPAYTTNAAYWNVVGEYANKLKAMTGPGIGFVDMTAISEWVYAAKKPKDCINDPLHPNDYLARWYAQSLAATLDPGSSRAQ